MGNKVFDHGDFYLTNAEKKMVKQVSENFSKVIVVMNVGGVVDTTWFKDNEAISSVLMAWQGGIEGGLTNGLPLTFCCAFKPAATLTQLYGGRHDACIAVRAVPVVRAMTALALQDILSMTNTTHHDQ